MIGAEFGKKSAGQVYGKFLAGCGTDCLPSVSLLNRFLVP